MRKLCALLHTSLNGMVADANGSLEWITHDDEMWNFVERYIEKSDSGIYGPITFGMMESFWPGVINDPNATGHFSTHAKWYAHAQKIVCSHKLTQLDNPHAILINHQIENKIEHLKNLPGKNLMIFGSPRLVQSLTELGLIDEYIISIHPVLLGDGMPLFSNMHKKANLKLVSSTQFKSGGLGLHYLRSML